MKRTYFCVDVSGSISDQDLEVAIATITARAAGGKQGDYVLLFDAKVHGIWPVEDVLGRSFGEPSDLLRKLIPQWVGGGGSSSHEVLDAIEAHRKKHGIEEEAHKVLLSDLMMLYSDLAIFDEKINIHP